MNAAGIDLLSPLWRLNVGLSQPYEIECLIAGLLFALYMMESFTPLLFTNVLRALHDFPDQFEMALNDRSLFFSGSQEMLRHDSAAQFVALVAAEDLILGNSRISPESVVLIGTGSANHDERKFNNPEVLDLHREFANEPLTFGPFEYSCAPMRFAMLLVSYLLDALFSLFPRHALLPGAKRTNNHMQSGYTYLPVLCNGRP